MSHDHFHGSGPAHEHVHPAVLAPVAPVAEGPSVLMLGAGARVAAALGAIALLWAAVAWALSDLAS